MDNKQLEEFVKSIDQDLEIKEGKQFTEVTVPLSKLYSLARQLRENEESQFDFLFNLFRSGLWTGSWCCLSSPLNSS